MRPFNQQVGVVGSGIMGAGIAQVAAAAGCDVRLFDARPEAVTRALEGIDRSLKQLLEKQKITSQAAQAIHSRIHPMPAAEQLAGVDLIVEAVVEELNVKQEVFAGLEKLVGAECILASNTSSFSISAIAAGLQVPGRLVGMHFFNPVGVMKLVEVVSGLQTDSGVADRTYEIAGAWGKKPVHVKSTPGFIVNRVARPFYGESLRLLQENAATPSTLDAIMRESGGFRMGPFELMDLIGLDTNFAVTRSLYEAFFQEPRFKPSMIQQEMVYAGLTGRKSGRGFYEYAQGAKPASPDTEPLAAPPERITVAKNPLAESIASRLPAGMKSIACSAADGRMFEAGDAAIYLTDGRPASKRAFEIGVPNVVVLDLALKFQSASRIAIAKADSCSESAYRSAVGFFQQAGYAVSRLDDAPGLAVMRTVAMLVNEAADIVAAGVCSSDAVDIAMQNGVNYPLGPFGWASLIGIETIHTVLTNLAAHYGEDKYRVSPAIQRKMWSRNPGG
jgi:3-hydroxybutyryl-CoA dehydrogenase